MRPIQSLHQDDPLTWSADGGTPPRISTWVQTAPAARGATSEVEPWASPEPPSGDAMALAPAARGLAIADAARRIGPVSPNAPVAAGGNDEEEAGSMNEDHDKNRFRLQAESAAVDMWVANTRVPRATVPAW